jgi:hypothetical protein
MNVIIALNYSIFIIFTSKKTTMKTKIESLLLPLWMIFTLILVSQSASSQVAIEVKNTEAIMSKGTQPCYVVQIPQAELKTVQQNWIKKLQESTKIKVKELGQELVLSGAVKPELTSDTVNIYSLLILKDSTIIINVFIEIDSSFFSPKEDKTDLASDKIDNSIRNYLRTFAVEQYKIAVGEELEGEEKILNTFEDDLKKLEKEEENLTKEISTLENDIEEKEREIKEIDALNDQKQQEILSHSMSMLTITGEAEKKAAKEKEKELEKEKKGLEKDRSKAKDDISSYKSNIEKNQKEIIESQEQQELKKEEILNQQEVVKQVEVKLGGIK